MAWDAAAVAAGLVWSPHPTHLTRSQQLAQLAGATGRLCLCQCSSAIHCSQPGRDHVGRLLSSVSGSIRDHMDFVAAAKLKIVRHGSQLALFCVCVGSTQVLCILSMVCGLILAEWQQLNWGEQKLGCPSLFIRVWSIWLFCRLRRFAWCY